MDDGYSEIDKFYFNYLSGMAAEPPAPMRFVKLYQNAPNPFNPTTGIRFYLPRPGPARLDIVDVTGRLVAHLADGDRGEGVHMLEWNGRNARGGPAPSGVYFCVLRTPERTLSRKMVLAR